MHLKQLISCKLCGNVIKNVVQIGQYSQQIQLYYIFYNTYIQIIIIAYKQCAVFSIRKLYSYISGNRVRVIGESK